MTPQQLKAMKMALEALEQTLQTLDDENAKPGGAIADTIWHSEHETLFDYLGSEITAIKEVLADHAMQEVQRLGQEIEPEPVAWISPKGHIHFDPYLDSVPLYTSPPQRTWVDLTDTQIEQVYFEVKQVHLGAPMPWGQVQFGKALLEKFKEVNQ